MQCDVQSCGLVRNNSLVRIVNVFLTLIFVVAKEGRNGEITPHISCDELLFSALWRIRTKYTNPTERPQL